MRKNILLIIISLLFSCTGQVNSPEKLKKLAIRSTESYIRSLLVSPDKNVSADGIIVFSKDEYKYLIDNHFVVTGDINGDLRPDAILTIFIFSHQSLLRKEHLILINKNNRLIINKIMEGDFKFLSVKDGIIYTEVSKIAQDSPLYGCKKCTEIVKYRFLNSDTVRVR